MDFKHITPDLAVAPQISVDEVKSLRAAGFRSIICNRPDQEAEDQPAFAQIEAAAVAEGMEVRFLPVRAGNITDQEVEDFAMALRELPGPGLAYCRTGTRSTMLWSLSQAKTLPMSDILAAAQAAGYDMNPLARRIANGGKIPTDTGDVG